MKLLIVVLSLLLSGCAPALACGSYEECMEYSTQTIGKTNFDGHNQSLQFSLRAIAYKLSEIAEILKEQKGKQG